MDSLKTKPTLALIAAVILTSTVLAQVKVAPGDLKESRRTDGFFNKLDVELKISGLASAKAVRVLVDNASDDTGKNLVGDRTASKDFKEVDSPDEETKVEVELKNTERRATKLLEISGSIELFIPSRDPRATITLNNFQRDLGKPIANPALKAAGLEVTVWNKEMYEARKKAEEDRINKELEAKAKKAEKSGDIADAAEALGQGLAAIFGSMFSSFGSMDPNDVAFYVKDPQSRLVAIEFEDAAGKKLERGSKMTIGGDPKTIIFGFEQKPPPTTRVKLFVLTPKSTTKTPFKLASIPLP
jgi:hypothetical protein